MTLSLSCYSVIEKGTYTNSMIYFSRISDTRNLSHCFFFLKPLLIWRTLLPFWSYFFFFFRFDNFLSLSRTIVFFLSLLIFVYIPFYLENTRRSFKTKYGKRIFSTKVIYDWDYLKDIGFFIDYLFFHFILF